MKMDSQAVLLLMREGTRHHKRAVLTFRLGMCEIRGVSLNDSAVVVRPVEFEPRKSRKLRSSLHHNPHRINLPKPNLHKLNPSPHKLNLLHNLRSLRRQSSTQSSQTASQTPKILQVQTARIRVQAGEADAEYFAPKHTFAKHTFAKRIFANTTSQSTSSEGATPKESTSTRFIV